MSDHCFLPSSMRAPHDSYRTGAFKICANLDNQARSLFNSVVVICSSPKHIQRPAPVCIYSTVQRSVSFIFTCMFYPNLELLTQSKVREKYLGVKLHAWRFLVDLVFCLTRFKPDFETTSLSKSGNFFWNFLVVCHMTRLPLFLCAVWRPDIQVPTQIEFRVTRGVRGHTEEKRKITKKAEQCEIEVKTPNIGWKLKTNALKNKESWNQLKRGSLISLCYCGNWFIFLYLCF